MKRGTAVLKEYSARLAEERLDQHVTQRCQWCPEWETTGTLRETRQRFAEHRAKKHPEARQSRRVNRYGSVPMVTKKTIDENIRNARAQGGATWDGSTA